MERYLTKWPGFSVKLTCSFADRHRRTFRVVEYPLDYSLAVLRSKKMYFLHFSLHKDNRRQYMRNRLHFYAPQV